MSVHPSMGSMFTHWLPIPLLAASFVFCLMMIIFSELVIYETTWGYAIGLFNFVWSRNLFRKIRGRVFEDFTRDLFLWGGLKTVLVFMYACVVLTLTDAEPVRFIVALTITYAFFGFFGSYEIIKKSGSQES